MGLLEALLIYILIGFVFALGAIADRSSLGWPDVTENSSTSKVHYFGIETIKDSIIQALIGYTVAWPLAVIVETMNTFDNIKYEIKAGKYK